MTRIIHASDFHFGAHSEEQCEALRRAVETIEPSVFVAAGDLTQRGSRAEFEAAAAFFESITCPKVIAPGNHDTPLLNLLTRVLSPFGRFANRIAPGSLPAYADEKALILPFNTARGFQFRFDWSLGVVNLDEVARLIADFEAAAGPRARIAVCHHPLITPRNAPFPAKTRRGRQGAKALSEGGIDLVLSGHLHVGFQEVLPFGDRRTYAIGSGTAFSTRTRAVPPGFNLIEIGDGQADLTVFSLTDGDYTPTKRLEMPLRAGGGGPLAPSLPVTRP